MKMKSEPIEGVKASSGEEACRTGEAKKSASCIAAESLSAYADGEYVLSPEEEAHLEKCAFCRKELEFLRKLNEALGKALHEECPPALIDLMSEKVRERIRNEKKFQRKKKLFFSPARILLRAAAAVAVFFFAVYFLVDNPNEGGFFSSFRRKPVSGEKGSAAQTGVASQETAGTNVDIRNLVAASSDSSPVRFLSANAPKGEEKPALIGEKVSQLWLYDKAKAGKALSEAKKLLAAAAENGRYRQEKTQLADDTFVLVTTRKKAVILVRALAAIGFKLVSPDQPQPEQKVFFGSGEEKTVITLSFLPK